jgi:hypothetical protein
LGSIRFGEVLYWLKNYIASEGDSANEVGQLGYLFFLYLSISEFTYLPVDLSVYLFMYYLFI